jgi:SAM-dependent methyltransferase
MNDHQSAPAQQTKYTTSFYTQHLSGSASSAHALLKRLFAYFLPRSVVDVGCGHGTWLSAAGDLGATELLGFDGHYVDQSALLIDRTQFMATDLNQPFIADRQFDLAISVEVAEHLPMARAESFVADLCRTSNVVLFSAAAPYQGGEDHLNEQWPEYWATLFRRQGYRCFDLFRKSFWRNANVESWYAQNAFLFVKADNPLCDALSQFRADDSVLSLVHPEIFLINVTRYRPKALAQINAELNTWRRTVSDFVSGSTSLGTLDYVDAAIEQRLQNPFTEGRLDYRSSEDVHSEIASMNVDHAQEVAERDELIVQKESELIHHLQELAQRDELIVQKESALIHRLQEVAERDELIVQKESELIHHRQELAERDQSIKHLEAKLDLAHDHLLEETRRLLDDRNAAVNSVIDTSVRLQELREAAHQSTLSQRESEHNNVIVGLHARIEALSSRADETQNALDVSRRENALLHQAMSLPHTIARFMPRPVKTLARIVRRHFDVRYLESSGYFDRAWYLDHNPDVAAARLDPIRHYVNHGAIEGRSPHYAFDTNTFVANRSKTRRPRRNPYVEFLKWHHGGPSLSARADTPSDIAVIQQEPVEPYGVRKYITATGWYGAKPLLSSQLYDGGRLAQVSHEDHALQTSTLSERFLKGVDVDDTLSPVNKLAPLNLIRKTLAEAQPNDNIRASEASATYTIITPFYEHLTLFSRCAESVRMLLQAANVTDGNRRVEWIVMNDDPRVDPAEIWTAVPEEIRDFVSVISDGTNMGISARQNQGIEEAHNEWILFLDCDDRIEADAISVLDHYIRQFPRCRFISSSIIDIDEEDAVIRHRIRWWGGSGLYEQGMNAGHLACIRRDLFESIGKFDVRFSGCQDYDLALRTAIREPILFVPEHLYSYRWHSRTQSVSQFKRQARICEAVKRAFLQHFMDSHLPVDQSAVTPFPGNPEGLCLIRTQGRRLDLLEETVKSVLDQTIAVTPCIIVHGDETTFGIVRTWAKRFRETVMMLHAGLPDRRRGYPLNVGLDFVETNAHKFAFFSILDDDDIYYPYFAERLTRALSISHADVAYCTTNSRIPGKQATAMHPPLPTACLVAGNFIPINAYIVRTDILVRNRVRLREDIDYLEDWDFLLSLLQANARFALLNETLAEFRLIGDGNVTTKKNPEHFEHCRKIVCVRGNLVAKQLGVARLFRDILDFDFGARPALTPQCLAHINAAMESFTTMSGALELDVK